MGKTRAQKQEKKRKQEEKEAAERVSALTHRASVAQEVVLVVDENVDDLIESESTIAREAIKARRLSAMDVSEESFSSGSSEEGSYVTRSDESEEDSYLLDPPLESRDSSYVTSDTTIGTEEMIKDIVAKKKAKAQSSAGDPVKYEEYVKLDRSFGRMAAVF